MRAVLPLVCLTTLLGACSMFGGEKTEKSYVGPASLSQDQVTELLNQQGYSNVVGLHKNGNDWIGSATSRDGRTVNFDIDKGGTIHTK